MKLSLPRCGVLLLLLFTISTRVCRAQDRNILQKFPSASIVRTLETGVMREVVGSLTPAERDAIATYLTGKAPNPLANEVARPMAGMCAAPATSFVVTPGAPQWNGWSVDVQ